MSVGRYLIVFSGMVVMAASCKRQEENMVDAHLISVVESWVQAEALHQKLSAEGKYKDNIRCLKISDGMSIPERDSLMSYWSEHPEDLKKALGILIDKK